MCFIKVEKYFEKSVSTEVIYHIFCSWSVSLEEIYRILCSSIVQNNYISTSTKYTFKTTISSFVEGDYTFIFVKLCFNGGDFALVDSRKQLYFGKKNPHVRNIEKSLTCWQQWRFQLSTRIKVSIVNDDGEIPLFFKIFFHFDEVHFQNYNLILRRRWLHVFLWNYVLMEEIHRILRSSIVQNN